MFLYFPVSWNSRDGTVCLISIDGMFAALANKKAIVRFQMPDEVGSFDDPKENVRLLSRLVVRV